MASANGGRGRWWAQGQVEGTQESESDTHDLHSVLTKHTSRGANGAKVHETHTEHPRSDGRTAGAGVGDHGRDAEDGMIGEKVRRVASHDSEGNAGSNTGSKSKRSDSAPYEGWREYIAASGRLYYHHKATKTTQWKKPF